MRARESTIEKYLVARVQAEGGEALKFVSPGRRHVPDRIVIFPGGHTYFVELKAPGQQLRAGQMRAFRRFRELGLWPRVIDSKEMVDVFIKGVPKHG